MCRHTRPVCFLSCWAGIQNVDGHVGSSSVCIALNCCPMELVLAPIPWMPSVLGWILYPKIQIHVESVNVTLLENKVFICIHKLGQGPTGLGWAPNSMTEVLVSDWCYTRSKIWTQTHRQESPVKTDWDGDWSDASTSYKMTIIAGSHQKQGERHGVDSPSESTGNNQSCQCFDLRWIANRAKRINPCYFKSTPSPVHGSSRKPILQTYSLFP